MKSTIMEMIRKHDVLPGEAEQQNTYNTYMILNDTLIYVIIMHLTCVCIVVLFFLCLLCVLLPLINASCSVCAGMMEL
jgi:hypothetical protein